MTWSPTPAPAVDPIRLGWSPTGPAASADVQLGWTTEIWRAPQLAGGGQLTATGFYRPVLLGLLAGGGQLALDRVARPFTSPQLTGAGAPRAGGWSKAHTPPEPAAGQGILTATAAFPPYAPARTDFTAVGSYTYTIPWWSLIIDIVLWPGGRAGKNAFSFVAGRGGLGSTPVTVTLVRGIDIPFNVAQITGTIGAGGTPSGNTGGNTTATAPGWPGITATAPTGDSGDQTGTAAGSLTVAGENYVGGAATTSGSGTAGNAPGGGGRGGNGSFFGDAGGPGGRGQVSIRARQS